MSEQQEKKDTKNEETVTATKEVNEELIALRKENEMLKSQLNYVKEMTTSIVEKICQAKTSIPPPAPSCEPSGWGAQNVQPSNWGAQNYPHSNWGPNNQRNWC